MIKLSKDEQEEGMFTEIAEGLLRGTLLRTTPKEVYVVKISNWFDHKWLRFSGTIMHEAAFWNSTLTIPPFNPSRVLEQLYFQLETSEPLEYRQQASKSLHVKQESQRNVYNFVSNTTSSGVFLWYSSLAKDANRGSLMIYTLLDEKINTWYASFLKDPHWRLYKAKNITPNMLELLAG